MPPEASAGPLEALTSPSAPDGRPAGTPWRTCVGCRGRAPRPCLVRYTLRDGALVRDVRACLPGRGAWLHDDPACWALAIRRKAFARALRSQPSALPPPPAPRPDGGTPAPPAAGQ